SDSDMHTLGYSFRPWDGAKSITDGASILTYLEQTAADHNLGQYIRFQHHVRSASWSSVASRWTLEVALSDKTDLITYTCAFLLICAGYYNYDRGYTPNFPNFDAYKGTVVHPQAWPDNLDYAGKRVLVIGSGATAVTLVPAMADQAAHVTMLQRSPTYVVAMPDEDKIANGLRRILPKTVASSLIRWKNVTIAEFFYRRARRKPDKVRRWILDKARKTLGSTIDVDRHFNPSYDPWDQRLCLIPNGDLFKVLRSGKASVVTDEIETFTASGLKLKSGEYLDADVIITATGLLVRPVGGIDITIDGQAVALPNHWAYKGIAFSDVPNLVSIFGYINQSWTLRADLVCAYVCRLLNHMHATGTVSCTPRLRLSDEGMPKRPLIENFSSGYIQRALPTLPHQGDRDPWINPQSYAQDKRSLSRGPIDDGVMTFL
ncbi:MAG: NAD(P)/FAD-dependent oxidoreductase, partial [Pseudomonadota bacterium]